MADAPSSPPSQSSPRTLVRPTDDRNIGGVCAGVARYLDIDPAPIRVVWAIAAVFGPGIPAYLIAWVLIPDSDGTRGIEAIRTYLDERQWRWNPWLVVAAVVIGFLWLGDTFDTGGALFPALLIGGGLYLLLHDQDIFNSSGGASKMTHTPDELTPSLNEPTRDPLLTEAERLWDPPIPARPGPPLPPPAPRPRSRLGRWAFGLLVVGLGCVGLVATTTDIRPDVSAVLAAGLLWCGVVLIVSTWFGRARGLLPVGGLLIVLIALTSVFEVPLGGGVGERTVVLDRVADIDDEGYRLLAGQLEIDLRELRTTDLDPVAIEASVFAGELILVVSPDQYIALRAHVDAGRVVEQGTDDRSTTTEEGIDVDVVRSPETPTDSGVVDVEASVGLGQITIQTIEEEPR